MKIITPTVASFPAFTVLCSPLELVVLRAAVGTMADLMEGNPELFAGNPRMLPLLDTAKEMYVEMERVRGGQHIQVQDETVQASDTGSPVCVPAMAPQPGSGAVVRASGREDQDVD